MEHLTVTRTRTPRVISASTLIGSTVKNLKGEDLGEIKEIVLDLEFGRIAYAVLSFGGFMGFGEKLFAIPFGALSLNPYEEFLQLDVDKEKLEKAEGFDKDDWPDTADRQWGMRIYTYYGVHPYWRD